MILSFSRVSEVSSFVRGFNFRQRFRLSPGVSSFAREFRISSFAGFRFQVSPNYTWIQGLKNIFDKEKNRETREKLIKEYNTPYWKDLVELRKLGDKLWEAGPELVNAERALYMPNIRACSLCDSKIDTTDLLRNYTSLVVISFNQYGEEHVKTFIEPFVKNFSDNAKIQFMKVTIEPNFAKSFIIKLFVIPSLKRNIPKSLHKNYIFAFNKDTTFLEELGINNLYRGYTFLVDSNCKIRWSAHGKATSNELETMVKLIKFLDEKNQFNIKNAK